MHVFHALSCFLYVCRLSVHASDQQSHSADARRGSVGQTEEEVVERSVQVCQKRVRIRFVHYCFTFPENETSYRSAKSATVKSAVKSATMKVFQICIWINFNPMKSICY